MSIRTKEEIEEKMEAITKASESDEGGWDELQLINSALYWVLGNECDLGV